MSTLNVTGSEIFLMNFKVEILSVGGNANT